MTRARSCVPLVLVMLAAAGGRADAQERAGLMGGFSLGGGTLRFGGASTDPAVELVSEGGDGKVDAGVNLYVGFSTSPRTAVLFEIAVVGLGNAHEVEGEVRVGANRVTFPVSTSSLTSVVFAGAFQYSMTSKVWVRGGIGTGDLNRDLVVEPADLSVTLTKSLGFAMLGATGVELWRRGNFAVDAQFHFTWLALEGLRIHAPSGQVGFTWY